MKDQNEVPVEMTSQIKQDTKGTRSLVIIFSQYMCSTYLLQYVFLMILRKKETDNTY